MTFEERGNYWERRLAEQSVSGLSARAWCRHAGGGVWDVQLLASSRTERVAIGFVDVDSGR